MDKQFEDVINYLKNNNIYLGQMTTPDIIDTPDGTKLCEFDWAALIRRPDSKDVFEVHGAIYKKWKECQDALGWPISNEKPLGIVGDRCSEFENGKIVWYSESDQVEVILNPELQCTEQNELLQIVDNIPVGCFENKEENISSFQITPKYIENEVNSVIENIYNKLSHKKEDAELLVHKVSEFLSKKFFVVMLGAIKAGKSTLVNSLVGREISPMGAGIETTLRSSIIIAADKNHPEGLYVYSFSQDQKNKLKEKIESLERKKGNVDGDAIKDNVKKEWWQSRMAEYFAYLGEINPEFEKKYQCHKHAFNKDVIVEILTKEKVPLKYGYNDEESLPLLISIDTSKFKEQKVNLLNCQCAIIDTPGLDGAKANNQTDSLLKAANQYADYFLFIQSSMSALTGGCKKYLEENSQIPTVAVYNKMSSSYWYDEKSREDFENSKATDAYENLRNCTPYKFDIGDTVVVNAGAAWEAISRKNTDKIEKNRNLSQKYSGEEGLNKLLNESQLPEYIQELTKKIKETRIKIKVKNARSKVIQEIKALDKKYDDELSEEIKDKKNEIALLEEENKDIRAVKHKFDNDWLAGKSEHKRVCYALSGNIKAKVKACIKESMDNNGVNAPTFAKRKPDAIELVKEALEQIKKHFYNSLENDLAIQNDKFNSNSQVFIDSYNQQIFNENLDDVKKYIDNIASLQDKVINDLTFTEIEGILNDKLIIMPDDEMIKRRCLNNMLGRIFGGVIDKKATANFVEEIGNRWQSSVDSLDETLRTKIRDIICAWGSEAVDDKLDRKISENENKIVSFEKEIEGIKSELSNLKSILVEIKGKVEQIKVN